MTKIAVEYGNVKASSYEPFVLLTSRTGGYFFSNIIKKKTRYEGFYTPIPNKDGWEFIKTLDSINLDTKPKSVSINNGIPTTTYGDNSKTRVLMTHEGALIYEISDYKGNATITLDAHEMYDYEEFEKKYEIIKNKNDKLITIKYTKNGKEKSYTHFITIMSSTHLIPVDAWRNEFYELDARRDAQPTALYVYDAFKLIIKAQAKITVGTGTTQKEAERKAKKAYESSDEIIRTETLYNKHLANEDVSKDPVINTAYKSSVLGLDALFIMQESSYDRGIYAGLPWFYQWWTRDEAISLGAFIELDRLQDAKNILMRQLTLVQPNGRISNRYPMSKLDSADGIGWCAARFLELLDKDISIFNKKELSKIYSTFQKQVELLEKNYLEGNFIWNIPFETWIDTGNDLDKRDGACLEIQLLHQKIHDLLAFISPILGNKKESVNRLADIKYAFYDGTHLIDRITPNKRNDPTLRPNVFIAYYLYPDLLNKSEWESCFDEAIKHLWLSWGGFASIEKESPLFHIEYTGQNNNSYHRGDSWYFLNNMAGLCLHSLNASKYKAYVDTIVKASTQEILFNGALGHHAEISSAKQLESQGCPMQAWSMAMFIEMIRKIQK